MVQINVDLTNTAPSMGNEPVPEGWYNVAFSSSEVAPNSAGDGARLNFTMDILDGEMRGRKIFNGLNIQHPKQEVVDRSYQELRAITDVLGHSPVVQETSTLHGIPFQVRVVVSPAKDGYDARNNVKGYKDAAGNEPGKGPVGGAAPGQFGGTAAPEQAAANPAFGGQPQGQQPAAQQGNAGWGNDPAAQQTQQTDPNPAPVQQQQQQQQQQQAPAGGFDPVTGQPIQPVQQQAPAGGFDPNTGQPIQPAQQQAAQQGNAGWTQGAPADNGGAAPANGAAPWGANGGPAQ